MEKNKINFVRVRDELSGELLETKYKIIFQEPDNEIQGLIWLYLESEYGDENIHYEPMYGIHYAKITNNMENLIV